MSKLADTAKVPNTAEARSPFVPSPVDVLVVRTMLTKAASLPFELANRVVEFAEYWTCSHTSIVYPHPARFGHDANKFLIRTPPVGFRQPLAARYTTDDAIPPSHLEGEYEAQDFEKYLGPQNPSLVHPVRKVVFTIKSHDQGWGGGGTSAGYNGSYTWFEAGLERFDPSARCADEKSGQACKHRPSVPDGAPPYCKLRPVYPVPETRSGETRLHHPLLHSPGLTIQCNKVANRAPLTHTVTWSWRDSVHPQSAGADELALQGRGKKTGTGEFVRDLKVGDVVSVWAKARFPAWVNHVYSVEVEVYWAA